MEPINSWASHSTRLPGNPLFVLWPTGDPSSGFYTSGQSRCVMSSWPAGWQVPSVIVFQVSGWCLSSPFAIRKIIKLIVDLGTHISQLQGKKGERQEDWRENDRKNPTSKH